MRAQSTSVGVIDPLIILSVLSFLIQAWRHCHALENTHRTMQEQLKSHCATELGRQWLLRRAARQIRKRADQAMTASQSRAIAKAAIGYAIDLPEDEFDAYENTCGTLPEVDKSDVMSDED